ncbi:alpha/beta fold hydrolase [Streptomyces sp. NPDC059009]|uniref:alpha/beta fold hydrolase n=1 Tax=Streptomyces sp. NPDC059009 TaxID=3346694 RepID=UPI0036CDB697
MTTPVVGTLPVSGATLHYEVRGQGPLLLLIPGGAGGAASFDGLADQLAAEYTVASYDPRGMSRSVLDDAEARQTVAEHAEDALRMLDLLSPREPARVFGLSAGAIVALRLLADRPERLVRVVAHEPPVVDVLPDAAAQHALFARVHEVFRAEGLMPAMAVFAAGMAKESAPDGPGGAAAEARMELPPQAAARAEQTMANLPFFVSRILPVFTAYAPDLDRLTALNDRLVVGCGQDSRGELPYRAASFLAERLGAEPLHFPGGHTGTTTHPEEFGALLGEVLRPPSSAR